MSSALNYGCRSDLDYDVVIIMLDNGERMQLDMSTCPQSCFVTFLTNIILQQYGVLSAAKSVYDLLNVSRIWNILSGSWYTYGVQVSKTVLWMYWGKMSARGQRSMQVCLFGGVFKMGLTIASAAHLAGLPGAPPWSCWRAWHLGSILSTVRRQRIFPWNCRVQRNSSEIQVLRMHLLVLAECPETI